MISYTNMSVLRYITLYIYTFVHVFQCVGREHCIDAHERGVSMSVVKIQWQDQDFFSIPDSVYTTDDGGVVADSSSTIGLDSIFT